MNTDGSRRGFWITNHLANPVLQLLLRSPASARLGRHLASLSYEGRRTRKRRNLVVQYAREGLLVWIIPGHAERKMWWRNLAVPMDVHIRLEGHDYHGRAVALSGAEHPNEVLRGVEAYVRQLPKAASTLKVDLSSTGNVVVDSVDLINEMVVVRIDLDGDSSPLSNTLSSTHSNRCEGE